MEPSEYSYVLHVILVLWILVSFSLNKLGKASNSEWVLSKVTLRYAWQYQCIINPGQCKMVEAMNENMKQ